jgi:hypothetical protein
MTNTIANIFVPLCLVERFLIDGNVLDDPSHNDTDFTTYDLAVNSTTKDFEFYFQYMFNTWVGLGYCPECLDANDYLPQQRTPLYALDKKALRVASGELIYYIRIGWFSLYFVSAFILLAAGVLSLLFESMSVAPDVLGYVSTAARNSRYLHLPKYTSAMSGGERAAKLSHFEVMMQDVKANADVGKIALGMKHEKAERLKPDRLYR